MIYRNTMTGEATFPTCENGCPCDEYITMADGKTWCPYCEVVCEGTIKYTAPPAPYSVDGDGWYYRPIREDESPVFLSARIGYHGFVSEDRTRLYLRGIEYDPRPAVPFESLGFPRREDLFNGEPE